MNFFFAKLGKNWFDNSTFSVSTMSLFMPLFFTADEDSSDIGIRFGMTTEEGVMYHKKLSKVRIIVTSISDRKLIAPHASSDLNTNPLILVPFTWQWLKASCPKWVPIVLGRWSPNRIEFILWYEGHSTSNNVVLMLNTKSWELNCVFNGSGSFYWSEFASNARL